MRDEFPDWGKAMQESRLTDFSHIDRNFLFDQDLRTDSEMRTRDQIPATHVNFMNEHSSSARDTLDIPSSGPRDEKLDTVTMEHDQSDLHPHEQTKDLPCSPSDSSSSKLANSAASHVIFRPFERPSRPIQRGFGRSSSVSVPRESRQTTGNPNINKQAEKNNDDMSQNRHKSMPQSQTGENTQDTSGENVQGASGENVQGASGENGNSDDFNTKFYLTEEKVTLRCTLLNCQGLVTKRTNKIKTVEFQSIFQSNDVVLLTETWTDQYSDVSVDSFETFVLHRQEKKHGSKRNSGGIILYIRDKYVSKDMLIFTSQDDILWVKISKSALCSNSDLYAMYVMSVYAM